MIKRTIFFAAAVCALSVARSQSQEAIPVLFTELSDTVLTVTRTDTDPDQPFGTVQNIGLNLWEWHSGVFLDGQTLIPSAFAPLPGLQQQWTEPEDPNEVNTVTFGFFLPDESITLDIKNFQIGPELGAVIVSDTLPIPGIPTHNNGEPGDDFQFGPFNLIPTFLDLADEGTGVPDSGSTSVLLLGGCVALLGLSRFRSTMV
jgi:hypothetical protein